MNYIDKLTTLLKTIEIKPAKFKVNVREQRIDIIKPDFEYEILGEGYYYTLLQSASVVRKLNLATKKFEVDCDETISQVKDDVIYNIIRTFSICSPSEHPRRTKAYKDFTEIVRKNRNNVKVITDIFNIYEYYLDSIKTNKINHETNDVHRKNIFQLLCLMEKKYGKTNDNK